MSIAWRRTVYAFWWVLSKGLLGEEARVLRRAELNLAMAKKKKERELHIAKEAA